MCSHKSGLRLAKFQREKAIDMASVSSHIDLKNRVSDFRLMQKKKKFLMRRVIKIR